MTEAGLSALVERVIPGGSVLSRRALRGGVSASVALVRVQAPDGTRHDLVLRRYAAPWHRADPTVSVTEFRLLQRLARSSVPAPQPLFIDRAGTFLGVPAIVTTRLVGRSLLDPSDYATYVREAACALVAVHRVPTRGLAFLPRQAKRLPARLARKAVAEDPLEPALREATLRAWPALAASPDPVRLVHGDYWPGNLLWRRGRLTGVVDWEDACLGDPAEDVATCRADLVMLFGPRGADGFLQAYRAAGGRRVSRLPFWDLVTCTLRLTELERWAPGWQALGRADVSAATARERIRGFAQCALRDLSAASGRF
ncbi:MAG: phosphotransferase [Chloroflexi bacterium]|nr:phosphotransferase [Chloroflexota bacterium]